MIVLAILAIWIASVIPFFLIGVAVGREDQQARDNERARIRAAAQRCTAPRVIR